ncbi:MAG: topoisomerase DNA-binding C4 zinc finger domain-containing protein [Thermodesulfobacteriota bacterium]
MAALVLVERKEKAAMFAEIDGLRPVVLEGPPAAVRYGGGAYLFQGSEQLLQIFASLGPGDAIHVAFDRDDRGRMWRWLVAGAAGAGSRSVPVYDMPAPPMLPDRIAAVVAGPVVLAEEPDGRDLYIRSLFYRHLSNYLQQFLGTGLGPGGLPLTYESLATISLLAEREEEIKLYPAVREWRLLLKLAGMEAEIMAQPLLDNGQTRPFSSREDGESFLNLLQGNSLCLESLQEQERSLPAPAPPILLHELVTEAQTRHRHSARAVLAALRNLQYRTDAQGRSAPLIGPLLPDARSAGQGIVPLHRDLTPEKHKQLAMGAVEEDVYRLIWTRDAESRRPAAPCRQLAALFRDGNGIAYSSLWVTSAPAPPFREGDTVGIAAARIEESRRQPVERYSYESLCIDLAEFGIPAAPLQIAMLESMREASYFTVDDQGGLHAAPHVGRVTAILARVFPAMQGINLCAYLEQTATEVTSDRKELEFALRQFDQTMELQGRPLVSKTIEELQRRRRRSGSVIKTDTTAETALSAEDVQTSPDGSAETDAGEAMEGPEAFPSLPQDSSPAEDIVPDGEEIPTAPADAAEGETAAAVAVAAGAETEETGDGEWDFGDTPTGDAAKVTEEEEEEETDGTPAEWTAPGATPVDEAASTRAEADEPLSPDISAPAVQGQGREEGGRRVCPVCNRPMVLDRDQHGGFWSCSGFPSCRYAEPDADEPQPACPICVAGVLQTRTTAAGKTMYVCTHPGCTFTSWARPHAVSCPGCGSRYLLEKKSMGGEVVLACPRAGCRYSQPLYEAPPPAGGRRVVRVKKGSTPAAAGKRKIRIVKRR